MVILLFQENVVLTPKSLTSCHLKEKSIEESRNGVHWRMQNKMDLHKVYYDSDNNPRTILQLVKQDPEWAANIIQYYERQIAEKKCSHFFYINEGTTVVRCIKCGEMYPFEAK